MFHNFRPRFLFPETLFITLFCVGCGDGIQIGEDEVPAQQNNNNSIDIDVNDDDVDIDIDIDRDRFILPRHRNRKVNVDVDVERVTYELSDTFFLVTCTPERIVTLPEACYEPFLNKPRPVYELSLPQAIPH